MMRQSRSWTCSIVWAIVSGPAFTSPKNHTYRSAVGVQLQHVLVLLVHDAAKRADTEPERPPTMAPKSSATPKFPAGFAGTIARSSTLSDAKYAGSFHARTIFIFVIYFSFGLMRHSTLACVKHKTTPFSRNGL
nr:hypothetical protein [Yoonia sp.]